MAIVSVGERPQRSGHKGLESNEYKRVFIVRTNSHLDYSKTVLDDDRIPRMLSPYRVGNDYDSKAFCRDLNADEIEKLVSGSLWEVTADYGPVDEEAGSEIDNPLLLPPEIGGGLAHHSKWTDQYLTSDPEDVDGYKTMLNSAGDPLQPVEIDDSRPELEITRNEAGFSLATAAFWKDAVNSQPWQGFRARTLKMHYIGFRRRFIRKFVYWEVTYHIHYRAEGWRLRRRDEGFRKLENKKRVDIYTFEDLKPVRPTEPQLLDGKGGLLAEGKPAVYGTFQVYKEVPFSLLRLF